MFPHVRNFTISFIISLILFGFTGFLITPYLRDDLLGGFTPADTEETTLPVTGDNDPAEQTEPASEQPAVDVEGTAFTMLLVGSDYQPGVFDDYRVTVGANADFTEYAAKSRHYKADTIMLLHVDPELGQYVITAIPNSTIVTAHGIDTTLGEVYESEPFSYFRELVTSLVGLNINYYIETRIGLFTELFNILCPSGLKYNIPYDMYFVDEQERIIEPGSSRETQYIYDSEGNIIETILPGFPFTIDLKKGITTLNGETASHLLRYAAHPDGDRRRTETACTFLKALFDTVLNENGRGAIIAAFTRLGVSTEGSTNVTSGELDDIIDMLVAYPKFSTKVITIPGSYITEAGAELFRLSRNETQKLFAQYK